MAETITGSGTALATADNQEPSLDMVPVQAGFGSRASFELLQRQATLLAASELVPTTFQKKLANCVIALEMANRMGASPLAVMQNLYIVHGKPSWSSTFIIAAVNSTNKFSPVRFRLTGTENKDDRTCVAWATEKATGEVLESPPVSIAMAKAEGWFGKSGSKWQTMPELMLRYRCATLFGRLYAPDVLMGMQSDDEVIDITPDRAPQVVVTVEAEEPPVSKSRTAEVLDKLRAPKEDAPKEEPPVTTTAKKSPPPPAENHQEITDAVDACTTIIDELNRTKKGFGNESLQELTGGVQLSNLPLAKLKEVLLALGVVHESLNAKKPATGGDKKEGLFD